MARVSPARTVRLTSERMVSGPSGLETVLERLWPRERFDLASGVSVNRLFVLVVLWLAALSAATPTRR